MNVGIMMTYTLNMCHFFSFYGNGGNIDLEATMGSKEAANHTYSWCSVGRGRTNILHVQGLWGRQCPRGIAWFQGSMKATRTFNELEDGSFFADAILEGTE